MKNKSFLIVLLLIVLNIGIISCNNEKMGYSDKINNFIRISSNYSINSDGYLLKSDTIRFYYYGIDNNHSTSLKAKVNVLYDDNKLVYYDEISSKTNTYTGTSIVIGSVIQSKNVEKIYANVSYTVKNETETYNYKISEEVLELSVLDFSSKDKNECLEESFVYDDDNGKKDIKIFNSFEVSKSTSNISDDESLITIKFSLSDESAAKYHLDLQMFAISEDGEIYNLVGWYNLGNNAIKSYLRECSFPNSISLTKIYVKAKYLDINGDVHKMLFKKSYSDI